MVAVVDVIDLVNPADEATGVPLNNSISITFDREIDEWSIEHGGLIVEGPDTDLVIHTEYTPGTLVQGSEGNILLSPGLKGLVPGTFTFSRISTSGLTAVNTTDTTGDGTLFRTRATFKPSQPMKSLTEYTVYLVGDDDDTDSELLGLRTRTVFDGEEDAGNTGDGQVTFSGTYLGNATADVINIRITKAGVPGVAEFEAWRDSVPVDLIGPFLTSSSESQVLDGVTVQFTEGTYAVGDIFTVAVKRPSVLTGTVIFSFTTGNGSITVVPTTTSTSITGDPSSTSSTAFTILSADPADGDTNLAPSVARRITIEFSDDIDPTTVTDDTVTILVEPVTDHPLLSPQITAAEAPKILTVSGNKLFIDL
jgi:hypothetical protein